MWVGNEGGVVNFLNMRRAKCVQSLKVSESNIKFILELDHMTVLAISCNGDITLIYTRNGNVHSDNINIEGEFQTSAFPTLGSPVTHAAVCPQEPD